MPDQQEPISYKDFAKKIKTKYPEYKDIDDLTLSKKMVEKYPDYSGMVQFEEVKKKETTASSATQLPSPKIESMAAPALQFGASLEKSIKPSIREAALADKKNNQSYLGALWNNAVGSVSRLAKGATRLASKFEATPAMDIERRVLDIAGQSMNKNLIAAKEKEYADKVGGFIEKARTSTSSKEYEKQLAEGFDITDGIGVSDLKGLGAMIPQLIADMGLAVPTAGTSFAIQGYDDALSLIDEMPEAQNISEGTRTAFGFGGALVIGALEKLGLDNILKTPSAKRYVTAKVLKEATDELVKKGVKVTAEQFEKQVADKAKEIAKKEGAKVLAKSFLKKGAIEGGTEAGQEAAMDLLKIATNKIEGKEIFDEEEMKDTAAARYLNSFAAGGVLGGLAGAVSTRFQNTEKAIKSKLAEAKTQEDIASIVDEINQNVQEGTITEDEANDLNSMVQTFTDVNVKIPQEVVGENRVKSIDLLLERSRLESGIQDIEKQKKGVDAAYHGFFDEGVTESNKRIEEINKELAELAKPENQIIETEETTEVPIQAEAKVAELETPTETIRETEVTESKSESTESTKPSVTKIKDFQTKKGNIISVDEEYVNAYPERTSFVPLKITSPNSEILGDFQLEETNKGYEVELAGLQVPYQRKGFGKDAYIALIENLDKPLISGKTDSIEGFSEDARRLWESLRRDGYAEYNENEKRYYSIKPKENAIQEPSTESLLQPKQEEIGETGSERGRMEQGEQGIEITETQQQEQIKGNEEKVEPPTPPKPPKEIEVGSEKPFKTDNKSILTRIYESENITPSVKEKFKDKLKYKVSSQDEARSIAKDILKEYDIEEAVSLAEAGKFDGDVNSFIFAESLDKVFQSEVDAKTPQEKAAFAEQWADIAMRYDDTARDKGRFIAAIADFYRKSPLGIKIAEEARRSDEFKKWFKNKEEGYKEVFEEITKEPEFKEYVKEEVQKELKKERSEFRKERRKKIEDAFDSFKVNKDALYAIPIPPNVYNGAVEAMKQAFLAGESIANAVEVAVEKISAEIKDWDKDKFRKEYQERLAKIDAGKKSKLTPEELTEEKRQKLLDKFRNKLKGLSEKEKDEVIRKSFKKLVENGALEYDDFKQIIAETIGLGELTAEETQRITQLVKDINDVETLANQIRQEDARSIDNLRKYQDAKKKAEKSATELGQLVYNKPNVWRRFLSIMQLSTIGFPSLVNNPIFNIANQAVVRFPIGVQLSVLDQILYGASKVTNRIFGTGLLLPQNNVALSQKEFVKKLWQGSKQSTEQLFTGLTNKDYFQKEVYSSQIHPFTSAKELWDYSFKGKKLTPAQVADKSIQATVGIPAEVVARLLNIGDKPQRYAAEGAQAATFAKNLGLKDIVDYEYFLEFPKEEAFRRFKQQGLSDESAMKKAEEIRDGIVKQGEESVFQQDNFLNDVINQAFKAADRYGTVAGNISETIKKFNFPFLKIPLNAFWSYYNLANPMVALTQSAVYAAKAIKTKSPIDIQQSKKWAAHATTGMALMAIAGALSKEGIVNSDNDDETTKKERMGEQQYEQQKSINITKLRAYLNGQDPNKVENGLNIDLKWLGVMGSLLNIQANKLEEMTPEQKEKGMSYMEDMLNTMTTSGLELIDNGVFSNASGLLTAINKGGGFADQYFLNLINMGTNIIQPAMFAQISRAQLPYYSQQKADDFYGQLQNSMLARSAMLRTLTGKYPPSKIGIWGDPMERTDNVLMKLFSMSKSKKDNFAQPIYEDYKRTSNTKFFPPSVKPEINKQKLNTEQARKLEELVGQARKTLIAPYIHDGAILGGFDTVYSKLSDEDKIETLQMLYEEGFEDGKKEFIKLYPQFGEPEPTDDDILNKAENEIRKRVFKQTIKTP